jgi:hypothetical protein
MAAAWACPPSRKFPVLAQQGDQVGESLPGGGAWVELELELGQSAAILASSSRIRLSRSASCSSSLSSCASSFSSCSRLCSIA